MWRPSITFSRIFGVFLSGMLCGYLLSVIFAENARFQQIHCHPLIHSKCIDCIIYQSSASDWGDVEL
jgi:hypothetical protein